MRNDKRFAGLFDEPCVLMDNGNGMVYRWEPLGSYRSRIESESYSDAVFEEAMQITRGEYVRPSDKADEAKQAADVALENMTALTSAFEVSE